MWRRGKSLTSTAVSNSAVAKFTQRDKFAFAIIAFGKLGKSARLSLNSILNTGISRICVAGDQSGMEWIESQIPESKREVMCPHEIPKHSLLQLGLDWTSKDEYSSFGKERFIKLTTYKWYLLQNVLDKHIHLDYIIFSDLDVLWLKNPSLKNFDSNSLSHLIAAIQDDTPVGAPAVHFCTGIMYWFNSSVSKKSLRNLYEIQFHENSIGNFTPDEPTFNDWFRSMGRPMHIETLNQDEFVIGHRFFRLLINKKLKDVTAFHANYCVGEEAKYRRLRTIALRSSKDLRWILFFFRELVIKVYETFLKLAPWK